MAATASPAPGSAVISLLTDYGLADGFVGALHSVLRRAAPSVPIVDLTHDVARQDVRAGSLALLRAAPYLAPGVVVAVVDPGVGTSRRGVAVKTAGGNGMVFIGPDNGLLLPAVDALGGAEGCTQLEDRGYFLPAPGPTFAGRDIFAPAAALVAMGAALAELGSPAGPETLVRLQAPACSRLEDGSLEAEVTWVDRFGNVQLAAEAPEVSANPAGAGGDGAFKAGDRVLVHAHRAKRHGRGTAVSRDARVATAFADLAAGELGLLVDSYGHFALVQNGASAAEFLDVAEGDLLTLRTGLAGA
jgi:S-adenosyl-L-methionine hydrolase (adenosine-forming)